MFEMPQPPGCSLEQAAFVPPDPRLLPECLDNFGKYYHAGRPDALNSPSSMLTTLF
jgi:hypothetical protein